MTYLIINALDNQTIKELNAQFNMHLKKHKRELSTNTPNFNESDQYKKLMEEDDEVQYNKNTY